MNKEIEIPEGYEAKIENNKVIFVPKESEDERIRKALLRCCDDWEKGRFGCMEKEDIPAIRAYLEKRKEQKPASISCGHENDIEWSEEDDKIFDSCMGRLLTPDGAPTINSSWFEDHCSNHPHWKPSELEIQAIKTAIHILTEERNFQRAGEHLKDILAHYEGSEPRKDWKPSEEQMVALKHYVDTTTDGEIELLYFDLKKLCE